MRPETRLQRDILKNLRGLGYKVAHVPNGATLSGGPAERARQMANLKHDGLMVGFPDLIVFADCGRCGFIEVKCEGAKQSDHQKTVQGWLDTWGHKYAVCRSVDDVAETLAAWGWL